MKRPVIAVSLCSTLALFAFVAPGAAGCLIYSLSLWDLVREADLVVVARVDEVETFSTSAVNPQDPDIIDITVEGSRAHLRVLETWKGDRHERLVVEAAGVFDSWGAQYHEGKTVLAFLSSEEEAWRAIGDRSGTIYPSEDDLQSFRKAVRGAVALQKGGDVPENDRIDWLVDVASRPGTRWYGLDPLLDDFVVESSGEEEGSDGALKDGLVTPHLEELAESFVAHPPEDATFAMMLRVLAGFPSEAVDETAVATVDSVISSGPPPLWIQPALMELLRRFGDPEPERRVSRFANRWSPLDQQQLRSLWEDAAIELAIPGVSFTGPSDPYEPVEEEEYQE